MTTIDVIEFLISLNYRLKISLPSELQPQFVAIPISYHAHINRARGTPLLISLCQLSLLGHAVSYSERDMPVPFSISIIYLGAVPDSIGRRSDGGGI